MNLRYPIYTQKETQFIKINANKILVSEISKKLGRSEKGIRNKMGRMGITIRDYSIYGRKWTENENKILFENRFKTAKYLMQLLPKRSEDQIHKKRRKLGLKSRKKYEGKHINGYGYECIIINRKTFPIHRLVVEKKLRRKLSSKENVHHINCIKTDNRIENLYLFSDRSSHRIGHASINKIIPILLKKNIIKFNLDNGKYEMLSKTNVGKIREDGN